MELEAFEESDSNLDIRFKCMRTHFGLHVLISINRCSHRTGSLQGSVSNLENRLKYRRIDSRLPLRAISNMELEAEGNEAVTMHKELGIEKESLNT